MPIFSNWAKFALTAISKSAFLVPKQLPISAFLMMAFGTLTVNSLPSLSFLVASTKIGLPCASLSIPSDSAYFFSKLSSSNTVFGTASFCSAVSLL